MATITGQIDISGIKQCNADIEIVCWCPKCKSKLTYNLNQHHLSYPSTGTKDIAYFYCRGCETEYILPIKIISAQLTLEYNCATLEES